MKREELIELNVPEEAIDKIMQINGADIEKAKSALEEKEKALWRGPLHRAFFCF